MKNELKITLQNRKNLLAILKHMPKEALCKIPTGFNNNIWWNIAHVVVTQQLLAYKLSGNTPKISDALIEKFKKGTAPDGTATDQEIKEIEDLLLDTIQWTQEDYEAGLFKTYSPYTTSAKITLSTIEDAIAFNNFHEGIHLGSILALKKLV